MKHDETIVQHFITIYTMLVPPYTSYDALTSIVWCISYVFFCFTTSGDWNCFLPSTILRHHHITPVLKRLHWLPVEQRIKYKIASITYKSLHYQQPSYLFELLSPVAQSGRRSSSNKLLNLQRVNTISGLRSFFSSAPKIWNYLPTVLRLSPSYSSFRSKLKTFLFPP